MKQRDITDAYARIRTIDNTIPDDVLDFMKDSAIEKLKENNEEYILSFIMKRYGSLTNLYQALVEDSDTVYTNLSNDSNVDEFVIEKYLHKILK